MKKTACGIIGIALLGASASAQTSIVVTTVDDFVDFGGAQQVSDLPGPDGVVSFREATVAVNNTAGVFTIEFAIPGELEDPWSSLLRIEGSGFVITRDDTTVDFLSQAIFLGDVAPEGPGLGILNTHPAYVGQPALFINASNCEVRGLGATQHRDSIVVSGGNNNRFVQNFTGSISLSPSFGTTTTGNVIGGTDEDDRNVLERISLNCGANDNVIIGNQIKHIDVSGSPFCAEGTRYPTGNRIGGPTPAERNVISGFLDSFDGQGRPEGRGILVSYAQDTLIEGNYIGVTADGMSAALNNGPNGVRIVDSIDSTIRGNLIAGIRAPGISGSAGLVFGRAVRIGALNDDVSGVIIESNLIGTDASGENPIVNRAGVEIFTETGSRNISDVRIGSVDGAGANTIAFADLDGIAVAGSNIQAVNIAGNSIHSNGELGIDLRPSTSGSDGVTSNDVGDIDSGPNHLQNFPVITSASFDGSDAIINGSLSTEANRDYRIEFFASPEANPSGHGEGQQFLGSVDVTTDNVGVASFDAQFAASDIENGWMATVTATDAARDETSEFSAAVEFSVDIDSACRADLDDSNVVDVQDLLLVISNWGSDGSSGGDANDDGIVDVQDLLMVISNWGNTCS